MNQSLFALLLFVSWTIILILMVITYRSVQVLIGKKKSNEFPAGIKHGSERYWQMTRAQSNAIENLPIFAALVLVGNVAGKIDLPFINACYIVVGARLGQSITHMISTSVIAVNIRFTFYVTQLACFVYLLTKLI
jgi:uncharacterized MAPEG superfamily protein